MILLSLADLHKKFRDQHREYSPHTARPFYGYVTTAIVSVSRGVACVLDADLLHCRIPKLQPRH